MAELGPGLRREDKEGASPNASKHYIIGRKRQRPHPIVMSRSSVLVAPAGSICAAIKSEAGPPMTLGNAARAGVRLIVWCRGRGDQVEPNPVERVARRGADTPVVDWRERI